MHPSLIQIDYPIRKATQMVAQGQADKHYLCNKKSTKSLIGTLGSLSLEALIATWLEAL
jgi:hypothetical protein